VTSRTVPLRLRRYAKRTEAEHSSPRCPGRSPQLTGLDALGGNVSANRRFLEGHSVRWFVYLNARQSHGSRRSSTSARRRSAVRRRSRRSRADAAGERGERAGVRAGPGPGVRDPDPRRVRVPGLLAEELRAELGAFYPPQGYLRLVQHPEMMAVCEKLAAEAPVRLMMVHHRI
jgi:hypothetical protein